MASSGTLQSLIAGRFQNHDRPPKRPPAPSEITDFRSVLASDVSSSPVFVREFESLRYADLRMEKKIFNRIMLLVSLRVDMIVREFIRKSGQKRTRRLRTSRLGNNTICQNAGLAKVWRKLKIPRSGRGYWAKKAGEKVVPNDHRFCFS